MANTDFFNGVPIEVKTFEAEKVLIYVREQLTDFPGVSQNLQVEIQRAIADRMVATVKSWLIAGRIPDLCASVELKWPDSPWQMFKERHLPEWFKQRFPVRYHIKIIETQRNHYFCCPHLASDPQAHHIRFMATGTRLAGEMRSRY